MNEQILLSIVGIEVAKWARQHLEAVMRAPGMIAPGIHVTHSTVAVHADLDDALRLPTLDKGATVEFALAPPLVDPYLDPVTAAVGALQNANQALDGLLSRVDGLRIEVTRA